MKLPVLTLWAVLLAGPALAQPLSPRREIEAVRSLFEAGSYKEALQRARAVLASQNFTDPERIELNRYAGLSAFNLAELIGAEDHLLRLLQLNPDYVLDPFAVPPATIQFFESLKQKHAETLSLARQQLALREEQLQRQKAAERQAAAAAAEESRRRLEQLSRQSTVERVEKRSMLVNFVPFGAGQFQQRRTGLGVALAATQGVLAATSVISYFAIESLRECSTITSDGYLPSAEHPDGKISFKLCRTPESRLPERNAWSLAKYATAAGFYTAYAYGVIDAIYHHEDEVVTRSTVELPPAPLKALSPKQLFLFPVSGGLGAGLRASF